METVTMIPLTAPGLAVVIGIVGTALAGILWKQPTPKQLPAKARRDGRRLR
jgi:hypothetical protein